MLPISMRTASCARLTQAFARFNLGSSRAYTVPPTVKERKSKKEDKPKPRVDQSQLPPKKPVAPFAKFIMENKESLLKGQGSPFSYLSSKWNELSAAEKKKYGPTAQERDRYYESFTQWKENVDPKVLKEINRRRKKKGLKPIHSKEKKHFANSYAVFFSEHFAQKKAQQQVGGLDVPAIGKEAAEKWRSMSDEEKQVYKDKAAAAKEEWLKTHGVEDGEGSA